MSLTLGRIPSPKSLLRKHCRNPAERFYAKLSADLTEKWEKALALITLRADYWVSLRMRETLSLEDFRIRQEQASTEVESRLTVARLRKEAKYREHGISLPKPGKGSPYLLL